MRTVNRAHMHAHSIVSACLHALVARAGCHAAAVEVVGHIVDHVLVVRSNIFGHKHLYHLVLYRLH